MARGLPDTEIDAAMTDDAPDIVPPQPLPSPQRSWLPMPHTGARRTESDWDNIRDRTAKHLADDPEYESGWHRSLPTTAESAWNLLAPMKLDIEQLVPQHKQARAEMEILHIRAKQALLAAIDAAIASAGNGEDGPLVTQNTLFDALAERWSDHYRQAIETTAATQSWEMRADTLKNSWRDLVLVGIQFAAIYQAVVGGCEGLYEIRRAKRREYRVIVHRKSELFKQWSSLIEDDREFRPIRKHRRLRRADDTTPGLTRYRSEVTAEWEFNVARSGPRSAEVIRQLEAARLLFDVASFNRDLAEVEKAFHALELEHHADYTEWAEWKWDKNVDPNMLNIWRQLPDYQAANARQRSSYERLEELGGQLTAMRAIDDDLAHMARTYPSAWSADGLLIRSRFRKTVNRRYQAEDFWPTEVPGKGARTDIVELTPIDQGLIVTEVRWSDRGRWFRAAPRPPLPSSVPSIVEEYFHDDRVPLVGTDVSASQVQILAVFLGLQKLERNIAERPFKELMAERHGSAARIRKMTSIFRGEQPNSCHSPVLKIPDFRPRASRQR